MSETIHVESAEESRIAEAAITYLGDIKRWKPEEYRLEPRGVTADGQYAILWAVHVEDGKNPTPGGGQSLELHVHRAQCRVVRELCFQ